PAAVDHAVVQPADAEPIAEVVVEVASAPEIGSSATMPVAIDESVTADAAVESSALSQLHHVESSDAAVDQALTTLAAMVTPPTMEDPRVAPAPAVKVEAAETRTAPPLAAAVPVTHHTKAPQPAISNDRHMPPPPVRHRSRMNGVAAVVVLVVAIGAG